MFFHHPLGFCVWGDFKSRTDFWEVGKKLDGGRISAAGMSLREQREQRRSVGRLLGLLAGVASY